MFEKFDVPAFFLSKATPAAVSLSFSLVLSCSFFGDIVVCFVLSTTQTTA